MSCSVRVYVRTHMLCRSKGTQGSLQMICALSQANQDSIVRLLNRKNLCPFFLLIFFSAWSNSNSAQIAIIVFTSLSSSKPTKAKMAKMYPKPTAAVCSPALPRDAPECPLDQQELGALGFWCHRPQGKLHVSKCAQKTQADWA